MNRYRSIPSGRMVFGVMTVMLLTASGCGTGVKGELEAAEESVGPQTALQAQPMAGDLDLQGAKDRWQRAAIRQYRYKLLRQCFCLPDYTRPMWIYVNAGEVERAAYVDDGAPVAAGIVRQLETVEDWFEKVVKAEAKNYHRLKVEYDAQMGFPRRLEIDRRERIADDELRIEIEILEPLEN